MPLSVAQRERAAICDLFEEVGPLAPTLCEGWTTSDLASHLFVREARPWAAAGIAVPQLAGMTQRTMDRAKSSLGYEGLVARIRSGPSFPFSLVDSQLNAVEYFVHHEDVRRAGGTTNEAASAPAGAVTSRDDADLDAVLWSSVHRGARLFARRLRGTGLQVVAPGHGSVTARAAKEGEPVATVTAGPPELMLFLFGRGSAAMVDLDGTPEAIAAVRSAPFGM